MERKIIVRLIKLMVPVIFLVGFSQTLNAQKDSVSNPEQFLFRDFSVGLVRLKDGQRIPLKLNYNIVNEKMVFMQKDKIYDLVDYETVDTVYIRTRKFVPFGRVFYELLSRGDINLFVQHTGSIKGPSRPAAYGGASDVSSSTYINNITLGNDNFRMKAKPEIVIIRDPVFWVGKEDKLQSVSGKSSLLNLFGEKKKEMNDFIGKYHLKVDLPEDMTKIISHYNSLSR